MFIDDLREAIRHGRKLPILLDRFIGTPRKQTNPLIDWAISIFGKEKVRELVVQAIRNYLPDAIRDSQEGLCLLNTTDGRKYLHSELDAILDYLTSEKYRKKGEYQCPKCKKTFWGKAQRCPNCDATFKWDRSTEL